jgi:alpha-2-macroglobulin
MTESNVSQKPRPSKFRPVIMATIIIAAVVAAVAHFFMVPLFATPPEIVGSTPADGEQGVNPQAPIVVEFSQWVQLHSVAEAITISPHVPLTVEGERDSVTIRAENGLEYGTRYELTIAPGVANLAGNVLEKPFVLSFTTTPYASVVEIMPPAGTSDVALSTPILVTFDTPVVPAEQVDMVAHNPDRADMLPQPLTLTYAQGDAQGDVVPGTGRWLSPTRLHFSPDEPLHPATTYEAALPHDLAPNAGSRMREPFAWSFTTAAVLDVELRPYDGATDVPPDTSLEMRLPPAVDVASASEHFRLYATGGAPTDGSRNERENGDKETAVAGQVQLANGTFRFVPDAPLQRAMFYEARLSPGVSTVAGVPINNEPQTWQFATMGNLSVAQVEPQPGTQDVLLDIPRISVQFNHTVVSVVSIDEEDEEDEEAERSNPLTIRPPLPGTGRWIDTRTFVYSPTGRLAPSTEYEVVVSASLTDQTGGTLQEEYRWHFTTVAPRVLESNPADGEQFADPATPVQVMFNQPMAPTSVQDAFSLLHQQTGVAVPGSVTVEGSSATFTPAAPLERGATYIIQVSSDARGAKGQATMEEPYRRSFRVAPLPALLSSNPAGGVGQSASQSADPTGSIQLTFSTPMDWTSVEEHLTIEPAPTSVQTYTSRTEFTIYSMLQPETDYRITIGGAAQDAYGLALGQDVAISFRTGPLRPSLALVGAYKIGTYNAYAQTRVPMQTRNVSAVRYQLYRLDPHRAVSLLEDYEAWRNFPEEIARMAQDTPSLLVASGERDVGGERNGERNKDTFELLEIDQLEAGLYYIEANGTPYPDLTGYDTPYDRQIMVVSPYALTIKRSAEQLFVWAVDLASGEPVDDLPLVAAYQTHDYDTDETETHYQEIGRTSSDGILDVPFSIDNPYRQIMLWTPTDDTGRFVFATSQWDSGIGSWDFGIRSEYDTQEYVGSIHTDRPIYRPEHTVYLRGAVRARQGEGYTLPNTSEQVHLSVRDPQGDTIFSTNLPLSEFGTFHTSLALDRSARPGTYQVHVGRATPATEGGEDRATGRTTRQSRSGPQPFIYGSFLVGEYRKPAFEVSITTDSTDLVQDETLHAEVSARYYSGGAVSNAEVRWRVLSMPAGFSSASAPRFRFGDETDAYEWYRSRPDQFRGGELIAEGTATTDADGVFQFERVASIKEKEGEGNGNEGRRWTLDVTITDIEGQAVSSQQSVTVHPGAFYVGLRPEGYVTQVGQSQTVSLLTVDPDDTPVGNRDLDIDIYRREWYSVREQGADGRMYWTSAYSDTLVETRTATTDTQGRTAITFAPDQGGSYRIRATAHDDRGHTIRSSAFTWAYGGQVFWGVSDTRRVDLIADSDSYQPGDTANILVTAPYKGMKALLTIERGSIIEHRVMTLDDTTELLQVKILPEYAPNVYVSLVLIKPAVDELPVPDMRAGLINLPVSTEQNELTIAVTPDKEQTGPRDDVTYTVRATDHSGQGVRAEVSLALVDKAVLALADDPNPTLVETFYRERPLGVQTAQSLTMLVDRVTQMLERDAKGGGGGQATTVLTRRDFPDTAYWNPTVVTDESGMARVTLTLPDTLTTWQMTARGITADTLVGRETSELVTSRPLLVRPVLPRFLTAGDSPTLQAAIHNNTSEAVAVAVVLETSGLNVSPPSQQTVEVPAGGRVVVRWQGEVPASGSESATLRFRVSGNGMEDAIEQVLPIQRFVTPEVVASAGQVRDTPVVETIGIPPLPEPAGSMQSPPDQGYLALELVPSLAAGVGSGLTYLEAYPYECTEQTVSRFLPAVVMERLFRKTGVETGLGDTLRNNLDRTLARSLQRLYHLQNLDGGWGWWSTDRSTPYLTAYVVQGLVETRKAGYGIDEQVMDDAIAYLDAVLSGEREPETPDEPDLPTPADSLSPDARAYVLFVLAEVGQPDRGRTVALYGRREELSLGGRAYLLMTLATLGGEETRAQTLVGELTSRATLHPTTAHWHDDDDRSGYHTMSSNTRTTALVLQSLVRAAPDTYLIPNAVRHLMGQREAGHWRTTQETAITLMALTEYIIQSEEFSADYTYRAQLDSQTIHEGSVNRNRLDESVDIVVELATMLANQPQDAETSRLTLEKEGTGRLYYTLRMHYYRDAQQVEPLDRGFALQREYIAVDPATLQPTGERISQAQAGEVVQVRLTLTVPDGGYYVVVEDMLPAGLEPLDTSLKTVTDIAEGARVEDVEDTEETEEKSPYPSWGYFARSDIYDNRVALFATYLPEGSYRYTYQARASIPGTYQTLPARAYQMYAPEVFGRSAGAVFVVGEP